MHRRAQTSVTVSVKPRHLTLSPRPVTDQARAASGLPPQPVAGCRPLARSAVWTTSAQAIHPCTRSVDLRAFGGLRPLPLRTSWTSATPRHSPGRRRRLRRPTPGIAGCAAGALLWLFRASHCCQRLVRASARIVLDARPEMPGVGRRFRVVDASQHAIRAVGVADRSQRVGALRLALVRLVRAGARSKPHPCEALDALRRDRTGAIAAGAASAPRRGGPRRPAVTPRRLGWRRCAPSSG